MALFWLPHCRIPLLQLLLLLTAGSFFPINRLVSGEATSFLNLRFSLWYPDGPPSNVASVVQPSVFEALLSVICNEQDVRVQRSAQDDENACQTQALQTTTTRQLQQQQQKLFGSVSILSNTPDVIMRTRETDESLEYSTWIVRYPIWQIADVYLQEALTNDQDLPFGQLWESAAEAMEQVVQLALDVSIMEGNLDQMLADSLRRTTSDRAIRVHTSLIRKEQDTFGDIINAIYSTNEYDVPAFSSMRIAGILLLLLSVASLTTLHLLAKRRRRRLIRQDRKVAALHVPVPPVPSSSAPSLVSPRAVEALLEQSATLTDTMAAPLPVPAAESPTRTRSHSVPRRQAAGRVPRLHHSISRQRRVARSVSRSRNLSPNQSRDKDDDDDDSQDNVHVSIADDGTVESVLDTSIMSSGTNDNDDDDYDDSDIYGLQMKKSMDSADTSDDDDNAIQALIQLPDSLRINNKKS